MQSTKKSYTKWYLKEKKFHLEVLKLLNKNEETLGELFTFFILETIMLSSLLNVNPIDQPSVELIKN